MKHKLKPKTAFNGVVILTLALVIVKILSAIYRVPYQNVLGDQGLYAYQQIYPIVALGMILSMNAIPSAVTQVLGVHSPIASYSKVMLRLQYVGLAIFTIIFIGAYPLALWMGDSRLTPMLRMASFSFILIGILGVLRFLSDKTSYEYSSYFPGNRTIDSSKFNHRSDCFIFFTQLVYLSGWYTRDFSIFYWIFRFHVISSADASIFLKIKAQYRSC